VTTSDPGTADPVLIRCPACGASEEAEPAALADAPTIVCRECGETWPSAPNRMRRALLAKRDMPEPALLEAERRPLVGYSAGVSDAWAAKVAGDVLPEPPRRRSGLPMTMAAMAAVLFLGGFFGAREAAVRAAPDLAGLYAAIGLPIELDGLRIEDVAAERTTDGESVRIVVRGAIRNVSGAERVAPPLTALIRDAAGAPAGIRDFDPPARTIAAGAAEPFVLELADVERQASEIVLRFARPADGAPAETGGEAADL
jgi:hypothetical protein